MRNSKARRGVTFIFVLAMLAVLSLLAVSFVAVEGLERNLSINHLDAVRARLIARAGVEFAVEQLRQIDPAPSAGPQPWRYWGDDPTETGPGLADQPLASAVNPSFAVEEDGNPLAGSPVPRRIAIDGQARGYSGVMPDGIYVLKVSDASGKLFVNEGVSHRGANRSAASRNMCRILNRLGTALDPPIAGLGDRLIESRPAGGYRSIDELKNVLSPTEWFRVRDFLTAHAWIDSGVANPVPLSAAHAQAVKAEFDIEYPRGNPPVYRFGRGRDVNGALLRAPLQAYPAVGGSRFRADSLVHAVYAMDELNPQWIEITSRAPVNVNAAPREVLIALLCDLRGVFLSERRRNNPSGAGGYHLSAVRHTYSPANMPSPPWAWLAGAYGRGSYDVPEGDEIGFLYETYPIVGPGSAVRGIPASRIADEIIACREKRAIHGFDYAAAPFGGPFRTWRQFYAFVDDLVRRRVLEDPRPIFYDHAPGPIGYADITGCTRLFPSDFQRRFASQAVGDVLKANFNPNLHLNELNPDRNLFLIVDKTDLVVNSTEFAFTPTGNFDIECIGLVLRPAKGSGNRVVAEAEIRCGVKLFDLLRETNQRQFGRGTCSERTVGYSTNNNRSLEAGPEPDNGKGPAENEWSGYLALPTMGGNHSEVGLAKPAGELVPTPRGGSMLGETIHTHLSWDFDAHYHRDKIRADLGSAALVGERVENFPDPDPNAPAVSGPYDPADNGGNYYRLCRSFRLPAHGETPLLAVQAPMDLRIDGGYLERHSALAYWISPRSGARSTYYLEGVISYWIKPSFFPERSGKPRLFADMSRRSTPRSDSIFAAAPFLHLWHPSHNCPPGVPPQDEARTTWAERDSDGPAYGVTPFKPDSMCFGVGYGDATGFPGMLYTQFMQTSSLNHEAHGHAGTSLLAGHQWTHVILSWKRGSPPQMRNEGSIPSTPLHYKILVNDRVLPGSLEGQYGPVATGVWSDMAVDWTVHANGERNSLRIGSPSRIDSQGIPSNNYSPDSTVDEIYFWNRRSYEHAARRLWLAGRYSFPKSRDEGVFTSGPIEPASGGRSLPPPSRALPPEGSPAPAPGTGSSRPAARILGISWTWFGENPAGAPVLTNHASVGGTLRPAVEASLPGLVASNLVDDGYSALAGAPEWPAGSPLRYRLIFRIPGASAGKAILLSTPVVDDVTLYVSAAEETFAYYRIVGTR